MDDRLRQELSRALGRVPSGLFVLSARDGEREGAHLVSWVMQAGFDPPALSVALGVDRTLRSQVERPDGAWAVSVIGAQQRSRLSPFVKGIAPAPGALEQLPVERTASGLAVVRGCLAWLECRTVGTLQAGDHLLVVGRVVDGRGGEGEPAVHTRGDGLRY